MATVNEQQIWEALRAIPDPEIPPINLVDLGVIRRVELGEPIRIELMPTFVGCPALDLMRREIAQKLAAYGEVEVKLVFDEPWTTERITPAGRNMLRQAGFAPPPAGDLLTLPLDPEPAACPNCESTETQIENLFGPTPCRSICYCRGCHQPFEQFKPV